MTDYVAPWNELTTPNLPALAAEAEAPARNDKGRFLKGHNRPGPGRPRGRKDRIGALMLNAVEAEFKKRGSEIVAEAASTDAVGFLRVVASLLPQQVILEHLTGEPDYSELTIDEIAELMRKEERNMQVRQMFEHMRQTGRE